MLVAKGSLAGKHAIVTGASKGIGLAIAKAFGANGAKKLTLVGRDLETLGEAKKAVAEQSDSEIILCPGSVDDRNLWLDVAKASKDVDILINSAGMSHSSLFVNTTPGLIEEVYQTNLVGTTWACQIIAKTMMRQRRTPESTGCIINISSLLGLKGGKGSVAYAASKAGVIAEMASSNIRFNVVLPGYIETRMTQAMHPDARAEALKSIPQKRFGTPEEVAHAAVFLATNTYANNCVLNLDGALSAT